MLTLYATPKTETTDAARAWQFVTYFDGDKEELTLTANGDANCVLHDLRLVRTSNDKDVSLIVAHRDFGSGYVDKGPVHFKFYQLRRNLDGVPGRPALYFERTRTTVSQGRFCDVGEASDGLYRKRSMNPNLAARPATRHSYRTDFLGTVETVSRQRNLLHHANQIVVRCAHGLLANRFDFAINAGTLKASSWFRT